MRKMIATAEEVTGICNAGYTIGDRIVINRDSACIDKEESGNLCIWVLNSILSNMCRVPDGEKIIASCPDPENINKVVFILGWEDVWNVIKKLSQYNWLRLEDRETEDSRVLCKKSWKLAWKGEAEEAEKRIDEALAAVR